MRKVPPSIRTMRVASTVILRAYARGRAAPAASVARDVEMTRIDLSAPAQGRFASSRRGSTRPLPTLWMSVRCTSGIRCSSSVARRACQRWRMPRRMPLPEPSCRRGPFTTARAAAIGCRRRPAPWRGPRSAVPRGARCPAPRAPRSRRGVAPTRVRMRPVEAFSHRTAATLHGLPVPWSADPAIEVVVAAARTACRGARGVRGHRADATTTSSRHRAVCRVVSPVDTWLPARRGARSSESSS